MAIVREIWRGTWVIAYREILRFVGDRGRLLSSLFTPLLFLVIFGAGFTKALGSLAPGVNYIQFMYPGLLSMTVLTSSLFAGMSVVWDREFGFLKEVLVAPLGRGGIVLGKVAGGVLVSMIQVLIMLILAPFLGVPLSLGIIGGLLVLVMILSITLSALGILVASFMRSQQGFQVFVQVLIFPLIFLAGVFFPLNNVPDWLALISKLNPLTYGVDAIRQVFLGSHTHLGVVIAGHAMSVVQEAGIISILGALLFAGAVLAFNRDA
jgi:ABC-2 type transport system permease protein